MFPVQLDDDPEAFGVNTVPNPPTEEEWGSACSEVDDSASESSCESAVPTSFRHRPAPRPNKLRRQLQKAAVVAAGCAGVMAVARRKQ